MTVDPAKMRKILPKEKYKYEFTQEIGTTAGMDNQKEQKVNNKNNN